MKSSFLPKYKQKIVRTSTLTTQGRNPGNFLFLFLGKRWLHKFILKITDLYSRSHWDHHIWLLHSESSIVKSLNKGSSNQPRRTQKWMHEKIPDMLMHFWSKKLKNISFWKVSPTSLEITIHSTYLRKKVCQFWC